jgi:hypothetical protein
MGGRYTITAEGREDLMHAATCDCHVRLVGLLVECPECGTVYGYTAESSMAGSPYARKDG